MCYSRKVEMPKTLKDGLCNFVQMIINAAEKGDAREALLKAVDLLNDLRSGVYDSAMGISRIKANSNLNVQLEKEKNNAKMFAAAEYARGVIDGSKQKQEEISAVLGFPKEFTVNKGGPRGGLTQKPRKEIEL